MREKYSYHLSYDRRQSRFKLNFERITKYHFKTIYPSREETYPTFGKGKSSLKVLNVFWEGICYIVPRRV